MARLVVRHHGREIANLVLESGREYFAGRGGDAQIRLDAERGISRHHVKIVESDGRWIAECLSKLLVFNVGGEQREVVDLDRSTSFGLPPFVFEFTTDRPSVAADPLAGEDALVAASHPVAPAPGDNLPTFYIPRSTPRARDTDDAGTAPRPNNEATVAGGVTLIPFLRISYPEGGEDVLKLEGQLWTAGRETNCEIVVNSAHMSRRHFEIMRNASGYFLTDLGSSNGTRLNNERIPAHEPTRLDSGDEIRVQNIAMVFEVRDPQFQNRLGNLPVPAMDPMIAGALQPWQPSAIESAATEYMPMTPPGPMAKLKRFDFRKNAVRIVIAALALVMVVLSLMPEPKPATPDPNKNDKVAGWDGLTPEKKNIIKDSFALARNLYVQGKYALCQAELRKVHDLIPQYENSKELENFCDQGLELVRRQEDFDRQAREKAAIEAKISAYTEDCKKKLDVKSTIDETRVCLAAAIEMAPEHPLVVEMLHSAQMREEERKFLAGQRAAEDAKAAKGRAAFERAQAVYRSGDLPKGIAALKAFLATSFPRTEDLKAEARRNLASAELALKTKIGGFVAQCKTLAEKGQTKDAYYACDRAVAEDKTNQDALATRQSMILKLHKEMRPLYEDAVLEESMGNVDTAKEKWKKILADDVEADDYFRKSKSKMGKYLGD